MKGRPDIISSLVPCTRSGRPIPGWLPRSRTLSQIFWATRLATVGLFSAMNWIACSKLI